METGTTMATTIYNSNSIALGKTVLGRRIWNRYYDVTRRIFSQSRSIVAFLVEKLSIRGRERLRRDFRSFYLGASFRRISRSCGFCLLLCFFLFFFFFFFFSLCCCDRVENFCWRDHFCSRQWQPQFTDMAATFLFEAFSGTELAATIYTLCLWTTLFVGGNKKTWSAEKFVGSKKCFGVRGGISISVSCNFVFVTGLNFVFAM